MLFTYLQGIVHSNPTMLATLKPLALYSWTTCLIEVIVVFVVYSRINSAVSKCMLQEVVTTNGILFIDLMLIASVTFPYFSSMSGGICCHFSWTCCLGSLVAF